MSARSYRIAYGVIENPARVLAMAPAPGNGDAVLLTPSFAAFTTRSPALRLNSGGWMNLPAETMANLRTHQALKDFCCRRVMKKATIFDRPLQDVLALYLATVDAAWRAERAALLGGASWYTSLTSKADWFFSAFLPLPNAWLELSVEEAEAARCDRAMHFDIMFWTGTTCYALTLERRSMPTPRAQQALARLVQMRPDITFVTLPAGEDSAQLSARLPELCTAFWRGLHHPFGPYRPAALDWQPGA